jgi:phosphoglycolate phosphatase-like HAD superfamily hydrolase
LGYKAEDFLGAQDPNEKLLQIVEEARTKFPDFDELSKKLGDLLDKYLYEIFDDSKYPLCKNAKQALKVFKEELNLKISPVSNRKRASTLRILQSHDILKYFDLVLAKEDQPKPKPSPEGVIKAMTHFSAKPEESVFIGDSAVDIISAKLAKVNCIGVLTGMGDEELLKKAGASIVVETLSEAVEILKRMV